MIDKQYLLHAFINEHDVRKTLESMHGLYGPDVFPNLLTDIAFQLRKHSLSDSELECVESALAYWRPI